MSLYIIDCLVSYRWSWLNDSNDLITGYLQCLKDLSCLLNLVISAVAAFILSSYHISQAWEQTII